MLREDEEVPFSRKPELDIAPASDPHTHTVIFLHGRGDDACNFQRGVEQFLVDSKPEPESLPKMFPSFRWVFPSAGTRAVANFTGHGTRFFNQWFDVWSPRDFSQYELIQAPGLSESVVNIRDLIADEAEKLGGRYDRIILMGISQGGATSVHTLLNLCFPPDYDGPRRLGGFIGFLCRMPLPGRSLAETRAELKLDGVPSDEVIIHTPIMIQHCSGDCTVPLKDGQLLVRELVRFGARSPLNIWKVYDQDIHWFKTPEGVDDAAAFLRAILAFQEKIVEPTDTQATTIGSIDSEHKLDCLTETAAIEGTTVEPIDSQEISMSSTDFGQDLDPLTEVSAFQGITLKPIDSQEATTSSTEYSQGVEMEMVL